MIELKLTIQEFDLIQKAIADATVYNYEHKQYKKVAILQELNTRISNKRDKDAAKKTKNNKRTNRY